MFQELQDLFLYKHGNFNTKLKFYSILIIFVIIAGLSYYKISTNTIIIICVGIFITNVYISTNDKSFSDFNNVTMNKLNNLQNIMNEQVNKKIKLLSTGKNKMSQQEINKMYVDLDSLYINANLISFLDSIKTLHAYNGVEFFLLLKGTNTILSIQKEIQDFKCPDNISELFENAIELKSKCINNLQRMIYTVPKTNSVYNYLSQVTDRYNILITRVLSDIHDEYLQCIKEKGLTRNTRFISYNTTKHFDPLNNHTSNDSQLIDFYI